MDRRKILALIFIPIGMILSILNNIVNYDTLYEIFIDNTNIIIISMSVLSFIITFFAILSIRRNRKFIVIGVLLVLFSAVISGIFYFIWKEENVVKTDDGTVASISWVCPDCKKVNYYNTVCECGHIKGEEMNENENICPFCGYSNDTDAIYCVKCGKRL